jgi:hypothetical protein
VIVKTCCILHNFVCQRESFQFQDALYECPLKSIKAVGTRGTDMGRRAQGMGISLCGDSVGEPGKGLIHQGLVCGKRL